jgi:hypothetical protein
MAGALIRRKVGASEGIAATEDRDTTPSYLLEFPGASSRIKDLRLAVLLGRQVEHIFEAGVFSECACTFEIHDDECAFAEPGSHAELFTQRM